MPIFFANAAGQAPAGRTVACLDVAASGTMRFLGLDPPLTFATHRSLITRMTFAHRGNYQFLHTIGNDVYIYVFGDRVGQISIQGLSLSTICPGMSGSTHGIEALNNWYTMNRLAQRQSAVRVNVGSSWVEGFVVGISGDVVDHETRIVAYNLELAALPPKR